MTVTRTQSYFFSTTCASTYDRKTAFMRVRWPSPCLLNHSNTSLSRRKCTEALPLGMTTRARFQKSAPTAGASGALTRVLLAPRAAFLLIALSEYLTVVFFCFMTSGFIIHKCVHIVKIHGGWVRLGKCENGRTRRKRQGPLCDQSGSHPFDFAQGRLLRKGRARMGAPPGRPQSA